MPDYIPINAVPGGLSPAQLRKLAGEGKIPGAVKIGRNWIVPAGTVVPRERKPKRKKAPA